ncbi:MAG: hypothetical protein GDA38_21085 [Hormoscilla sp. SP12CHS1]|nr:hypothetical protein [Hormoscilla sp. SP12CHS1]
MTQLPGSAAEEVKVRQIFGMLIGRSSWWRVLPACPADGRSQAVPIALPHDLLSKSDRLKLV